MSFIGSDSDRLPSSRECEHHPSGSINNTPEDLYMNNNSGHNSTGHNNSGHSSTGNIEKVRKDPVRKMLKPRSRISRYSDLALLYLILAFFGITGCLARMGLQVLTDYPGSQFGGVLWANFTGCLFLGFLVRGSLWTGPILDEANSYKRRVYQTTADVPLYIGLATGACGSITSFSSFIVELFYLAANLDTDGVYEYRNPGYGVMTFLSYLIVTMGVSFYGFSMGKHLSALCESMVGSVTAMARLEYFLELVLAFLGIASWIIMLVLTIVKADWRNWTYPCVFAPLGVYARFWAARRLNPRSTKFLWGTFFANITGTLLISVLILLERGFKVGSSSDQLLIRNVVSCQTLQALEVGFCGTYTTVSTFISELSSLKRTKQAYIYGATTIAAGFICVVLILGSYAWTNGLNRAAVC